MDEVRAVAESRSKAGLEIFPEIYRNGSLLECTKTRAVYKSPYLATSINEWIRATNILSVIVPIRDAEGAAHSRAKFGLWNAKSAEEQLRYNVSDKLSPKLSFVAAQDTRRPRDFWSGTSRISDELCLIATVLGQWAEPHLRRALCTRV